MMSLAFSQKKSKPTIGLIHSHSDKIFYQKIVWSGSIPKPLQSIEVMNWQNFLKNLDKSDTVFHSNCYKLIDKEEFISAKLSSVPVGILAYEMFEDFVIKNPTNLVSNYVSPFNIKK